MPQARSTRNVYQLLTLTAPTREQVLTTLARILLRNACRSSEGALSVHRWDGHQTTDCAEQHSMNQNGSITLFHYWNRLRDGRPAPKRSEVEPADIKSLLADTFILERDTRGEAVFRLAGTRLCASYGRELKGFSFPSLVARKGPAACLEADPRASSSRSPWCSSPMRGSAATAVPTSSSCLRCRSMAASKTRAAWV